MLELVTTRHNPLVDPSLHIWGWEIPVYLFLGGWVAGCMVLSGWLMRRGRAPGQGSVAYVLPWVGIVLLSLGMGALFLDLEHKLYVWRMYLTLRPTSPMSWGGWILILVYPVMALAALAAIPRDLLSGWPSLAAFAERLRAGRSLRLLGTVSIASGIALGIYTGILLSSLGARPLWASAVLGPLFLVSGLSTGAAFAHMIARDPEEESSLLRADILFLVTELALIALFLIGHLTSGAQHAHAVALLLGGPYTAVFWVFVVGLGIVVPLVIQSLMASHRIGHTVIAPLLVMAGGLALRIVIVAAGQYSHWIVP
ncbi:MAG: polysulfide reductase [Gammaproteobacteria bacterium]|nr:polysulfide reductase [Gammaproteobacteria bacterium]